MEGTLLGELLDAASGRVGEVLDRLPAVVGVFRGPQHVVEYANPLYRALAAGEPLVGRPVAEVFTQPENRPFFEAMDRVYATGEPCTGDEWGGVIGGEKRFFDFAFVPLHTLDGSVGGVMVHAVEVTGLVESRRRFRALVDANIVGITVSGEERVLEANDAWLAMVGRTRAELEAGLSWRAITPAEWVATDAEAMRGLAADGRVEPYQKEYARPDGTRVPVLISGVRTDAHPLRVVALAFDLTEREQLLARERAAADRTARLQAVTAALSAASSADEVGTLVVDQAIAALSASAGALAFVDDEDVVMRHDRGFEADAMAPWRRFPLALRTPVGDALRGREPVLLEGRADWERRYPEIGGRRFGSMAVVPLALGAGALVLCDLEERRLAPNDRTFLAALADQAGQALERSRLYEERAYVAHTLQTGLLPERLAAIPGLDIAVRYHSIADGGAVGGDFYDCFDTSPGRWLLVVGDVAGKGTAAAVLTGLARHTLRAIALREDRPEDMLRFLNEALRRQSAEAAFCTVGCATLERGADGFDVCLASGGHPYPLLVRAGSDAVEEVVVRGMLLGVEAAPVFEQVPLTLAVGDTLVLYTDGMTDASGPGGEHFGEARLHAAVAAAAGAPSADAVAAAVDEAVRAFEDGHRRRDDRAVMVLRVTE